MFEKNALRVTVVIGAYGKPLALEKTLNSFVAQENKELQVLIIDDNCPSNPSTIKKTVEIVNQFSSKLNVRYIKNRARVGVPDVFKKWIDQIDTEFFMLYGDGDEILPKALAKLIKALDKNPQAALAHGKQAKYKKDLSQSSGKISIIDSKKYLKSTLVGGPHAWSQMACLIRTELFKLKTEVVKDWYWDHYFHCQLHLFTDYVCSVDDFITLREPNIDAFNQILDNKKIFRHHSERKLQSLDFIRRYERILLYKGLPVNRFRLKLISSLFLQFFFISDLSKKMLIIRKIIQELSSIIFSAFFVLVSYPITLLALIILPLVNKILKKK